MARRPEPHAPLVPAALVDAVRQAYAAANAQRAQPYRLALLELTVNGYLVARSAGWAGGHELRFCLQRPPFWQRLRRPARAIACTVRADAGGVATALHPLRTPVARRSATRLARLQAWLRAWLTSWRQRVRNRHAARPSSP